MLNGAARAFTATVGRAVEPDRLPSVDHRPWPPPREPWVMAQRWEHVLFLHWRVPRPRLERLLPPTLPVDTFDGSAWLTITPLSVRSLRMRGLPAIPGLSDFPEINVRTYVTVGGKPGVVFFSLDAGTAVGVVGARLWYRLPYFFATAGVDVRDGWCRFSSRREHPDAEPAAFTAQYRPTGEVAVAPAGSLDAWLTERYCLYAFDALDHVYRAEIHHAPWPLQPAIASLSRNSMTESLGLPIARAPARLSYARRLDVAVWPLVPVARQPRRAPVPRAA